MTCALQTLSSEASKDDCHSVGSDISAEPTLSVDSSCPALDSGPQYVLDTETGINYLSYIDSAVYMQFILCVVAVYYAPRHSRPLRITVIRLSVCPMAQLL